MGRFAKIAMAAAAIIVFFMVTAMPGIIRNKNTNQPAAQVEKSTEEDNSQTVQVNQEMNYYLLLGTDGRTDKKTGTHADAIVLAGMDDCKAEIFKLISQTEPLFSGAYAVRKQKIPCPAKSSCKRTLYETESHRSWVGPKKQGLQVPSPNSPQ